MTAASRNLPRILAATTLAGALAVAAVLAQEPAPQNNPPKLERNPAGAIDSPTPAPSDAVGRSQTAIRFSGASHFNEKQLRTAIADQITALDQQGVSPALADDAAFFLSVFYRRNGPHSIALNITEGPLTMLSGVHFHGVSGLPVATLQDYITGTTRERSSTPKAALPFVQADVDTGVDRIRGLYASEGFLDAIVDPPKVTLNDAHTTASVDVTVHEGIQYHFGKITFAGDLVFYPNTELLDQLKPFTSKPYTPDQVTNMQRAVIYYYKTHGYYDPQVDVQSDKNSAVAGNIPVLFTVQSGAVYRFGGVSEEGLDRLSPSFLPDRFASLKGKFYNPQALDEKFREMMQTGLFRELRIEPRPLPDNTIELHMKVVEEKAKELGASIGYGTQEGPIIGFIAGDRDLLGHGRPLTANLELSSNFLRGDILYSDPWFLDSDYALQARLYGLSQQWYRYNVLETGFRPEISRQLTKSLQASVFYLGKEVKTTDQGIDPAKIGPSSYFVSSLGTSINLDTRSPDKINPTKGWIGSVAGEVASASLGSSVEYLRATGRITYYLPITAHSLLALGARGGWMKPLSGSDDSIPIDERFFNGGSRSVRSFLERRLGPSDYHGYTIGGDTFTTFNAEYQFPLFAGIIGAAFADAGSVGASPTTIGRLRYGVGPGLRYATPVGPLRLDVGFNPDRRIGERRMVIQISFGTAF
jgi:outer membrane protein assembly complex protein YaeT